MTNSKKAREWLRSDVWLNAETQEDEDRVLAALLDETEREAASIALAGLAEADAEPENQMQPKPTLEGPHWDDVVAGKMLTFKGQQLNKCLLDLRESVRELQSKK